MKKDQIIDKLIEVAAQILEKDISKKPFERIDKLYNDNLNKYPEMSSAMVKIVFASIEEVERLLKPVLEGMKFDGEKNNIDGQEMLKLLKHINCLGVGSIILTRLFELRVIDEELKEKSKLH